MSMRTNVIKIARSQLGFREPTGDDKYIRWYNATNKTNFALDASWCAMFASWVLREASVPESLLPNFASCSVALEWAKKKKIWYSRLTNHVPKAGELILFDWNTDGRQDHVGIVETVTANQITTIEGNTGDSVGRKTYSRTSKYILGYIDVQYNDDVADATTVVKPSVTKPVATIEKTEKAMSVKDIQKFLVETYGMKIAVDGIWGPASKTAMIKCVQTAINRNHGGHLIVDGIFGYASKKTMPILKTGSTSILVELVQMCLMLSGYTLSMTGTMDAKTLEAIKAFQQKKSLLVDGEVGPATMAALLK